jgi:hypothetical protein
MVNEEVKQLEIMNQNLVTLAMNQAILFSEMKAIKNNLYETHNLKETKTLKIAE